LDVLDSSSALVSVAAAMESANLESVSVTTVGLVKDAQPVSFFSPSNFSPFQIDIYNLTSFLEK
jgi:hypothetical protein